MSDAGPAPVSENVTQKQAAQKATPAQPVVRAKNDPRRTDQIRSVDVKIATNVDDSTYEWMTLVAMLAGMAGVMFKVCAGDSLIILTPVFSTSGDHGLPSSHL